MRPCGYDKEIRVRCIREAYKNGGISSIYHVLCQAVVLELIYFTEVQGPRLVCKCAEGVASSTVGLVDRALSAELCARLMVAWITSWNSWEIVSGELISETIRCSALNRSNGV